MKPTFSVYGPSELIAAIPAILGFHPHRSLIVISLAGSEPTTIDTVMRHDLILPATGSDTDPPTSPSSQWPAVMTLAINHFAVRLERDHGRAAIAVIIDEDTTGHAAHHRALAAALAATLDTVGGRLLGAWVAPEITAGAPWRSLTDNDAGRVADPATSPLTAAHVYAGRRILASRTDLEALLTVDATRQREVRALIDAAAQSPDLEHSLGIGIGDGGRGYHKRTLEQVLRRITHQASGEPLLDVELAELAVTLGDHFIRDALLALAATEAAEEAEGLWLLLTRTLPDPERSEAAALLGFSACLRGDGALARIALDAALDADPQHRLANLLATALDCGINSVELTPLTVVGNDNARTAGVQFPPLRAPDAGPE